MATYTTGGKTYFRSEDVKVFPCAYRGYAADGSSHIEEIFDPEARGFTEYNYTNIYSKPGLAKESFLVSWNSNVKLLKCVIGGYYFELRNIVLDELKDKNLCITLEEFSLDSNYTTKILASFQTTQSNYLDTKVDNIYLFTGLAVLDDDATGGTISLKIFDADGNIIPTTKRLDDILSSGDSSCSLTMLGDSNIEQSKSIATGIGSIALGPGNSAVQDYTLAIGKNNTAGKEEEDEDNQPIDNSGAIAIGHDNKAEQKNAVAIGHDLVTKDEDQVLIGNNTTGELNDLFVVGNTGKKLSLDKEGNMIITGNMTSKGTEASFLDGNLVATKEENESTLELGTPASGKKGTLIVYGAAAGNKSFEVTSTNITATKPITITDTLEQTITNSTSKYHSKLDGNLVLGNKDGNTKAGTITLYSSEATTEEDTIFKVDDTGNTSIDGTLSVAKATTLDNSLAVKGATTLADGLTINTTIPGSESTPATTVNLFNANAEGIKLNKDTTITGALKVSSDTTIAGDVTIGSADSAKNLTVSNKINCQDLQIGLTTIDTSGKLTINTISAGQITSSNTIKASNFALSYTDSGSSAEKLITVNRQDFSVKDIDQIRNFNNNGALTTSTGGHFIGNLTVTHKTAVTGQSEAIDGATTDSYLGGDFAICDSEKVTTKITNAGTAYFAQKLIIGGTATDINVSDTDTNETILGNFDDGFLWADENRIIAKGKILTKDDIFAAGSIAANGDLTIGVSKNTFNMKGSIIADDSITATTFDAKSDIRLKQNIVDYKCEKSILDLPVKEFEYKADEAHIKHIGCIAQDLQEICPELVHENKDGYLTIEENKLVYLLLQEVKQLKEEIKDLKKE